MSPSSCYGNTGCYCSCLGSLNIAPFLPEEISNGSYCILISKQLLQLNEHLQGRTWKHLPVDWDTLNISVLQDLAWRLRNLPSPFRLQVNTWREMLLLFLCVSDGTSPNRTNPTGQPQGQHWLRQLGLGLKVLWIIFQVFIFFHLPWAGRGINQAV